MTPSLPVGIPQFANVREKVGSGLRPILDGVEWLRENGYQAVLHIRQPGEDDTSDRKLFEMRGLKYLSLEISPQTLSGALVQEFNRIVADPANLPLFVYDKDSVLAGGLWYLHFRTVDHASAEEARVKAARLGFKEDHNEQHRLMWLAIQKYLSEQSK
jgi:hypothetical protein